MTDNSGKLLLGSMQAPREMILFINMLKELANMSAKGEAVPKLSYEPSQVKSKVNYEEKNVCSHPGIWGDSVLIWYCSSPIPISIVYSCSSPKVRKGLSNQSKYIETYIEKEKTPSTRTSQNWIAIIVDDGLFVPIACPIAPYKDGRSCIFRGTILAGNNVCLCVQRESMERIHG